MRFHVANVRTDDAFAIDRLVGFLADNPDPGIRIRPRLEVDRAVATGLALRVDDEHGVTKACSLIYKYSESGDTAVYSEIGTMRVITNGYGMQLFLAHLHLMQISLEEYFASPNSVFAVVAPGSASDHVLREKAGMFEEAPPPQLQTLRSNAGVAFSSGKSALWAGNAAIKLAFANLKSWHIEGATFHTPKNDGEVTLDMRWFDPQLLSVDPTEGI